MNTRKYPRTLLEAFGVDANSACALERPSRTERGADVLLAVAIGLALAYGLFVWVAA